MESTYAEFMAKYRGDREVIEVDVRDTDTHDGLLPFIIVKDGERRIVLTPYAMSESANHQCIDAFGFDGDQAVTVGTFGMTNGARYKLDSPTTSHRWPSAGMVALIVGEQA